MLLNIVYSKMRVQRCVAPSEGPTGEVSRIVCCCLDSSKGREWPICVASAARSEASGGGELTRRVGAPKGRHVVEE